MALTLDVGANTRAAQREIRDLSKALDDNADALDDLARESDRAADKVERSFRDMVREAGKAEKATRDIGDGAKKGLGKAGEAAGEFKQEALQNLSEVTSSFDGSMSSIQDLVQGTFGGLASSLPGIGLGAAGAAVGVGLIGSAMDAADEKRKALQERASDLAAAYIKAGDSILDGFAGVERAQEIITDPERRAEVERYAAALGVDLSVALGAYVGRAQDVATIEQVVAQKRAENTRATEAHNAAQSQGLLALDETYAANQRAIDAGSELIQVQKDAATAFANYSEYLQHVVDTTADAKRETDEFGDTIVTLPDGKQIYIDAETGKATDDVDAITQKIYSVPTEAKVRLVLDDSAVRNYNPPRLSIPTYFQTPSARQLLP